MNASNQLVLDKLGVDSDTYSTLKSSIFPGAKDESIAMAISYCRAAKLDILQKPVHIVPMSIKNGDGKYEWRDVVMPGITLYRIQAARSGLCAGIMEPEYGPTIKSKIGGTDVSYPQWCKITVRKLVGGMVCDFSAKEFWIENFASTKEGRPNAMWLKRPFGQLAKCSEAQAWRKAFPELMGGTYTAEEMEGKGVVSDVVETHKPSNLDESITIDQVLQLRDKMVESATEEMAILNHLKLGCLEEMKIKDFLSVGRQLDRKIEKSKAPELEINKMLENGA